MQEYADKKGLVHVCMVEGNINRHGESIVQWQDTHI